MMHAIRGKAPCLSALVGALRGDSEKRLIDGGTGEIPEGEAFVHAALFASLLELSVHDLLHGDGSALALHHDEDILAVALGPVFVLALPEVDGVGFTRGARAGSVEGNLWQTKSR